MQIVRIGNTLEFVQATNLVKGPFGLLLGMTIGIGLGMRQNDNGYEKVYDYDCLCLVDKIWYEKVYRYLKYVVEKKGPREWISQTPN